MDKWEYKTLKFKIGSFWGGVNVDEQQFEDILNEAGSQGWELVSSVDTSQYQGQSKDLIVVMKRKRT
ncbi:DUF4177 domain-containing protein [Paenibacillus radicis (ex Gao et al. 2016)]|uniref:DUF4177 domain-containing protein n=1 Tax=Paenibacillus radicis (ex Gao et al. 2016) TaxID=1737354 RepID=A0A917HNS9_9BACL|nr:DUF4177 domain-containing protein [Paenibacillus radicis (ex Gao et al. 2016)]GGG85427.1 hypothetical protein GCM10010918_49230 [Paenibacillus radicis (ex Gao et al. 2016)]